MRAGMTLNHISASSAAHEPASEVMSRIEMRDDEVVETADRYACVFLALLLNLGWQ
jgi:hypothetical protein